MEPPGDLPVPQSGPPNVIDDATATIISEFTNSFKDRIPANVTPKLEALIASRKAKVHILEHCNKDQITEIMSNLDRVLPFYNPNHVLARRSLRFLRKICATKGCCPPSLFLPQGSVEFEQPRHVGLGSFGIVYRGRLNQTQLVAIKLLRGHLQREDGVISGVVSSFPKEAIVWKHLEHDNIVPFLGVDRGDDQNTHGLVSLWMDHGQIGTYLNTEAGQRADRRELIMDVARGLSYLNEISIVHGDLKCANILVDAAGHARLADFGLSVVMRGVDSTHHKVDSEKGGGTKRWMSPELHRERPALRTAQSDIYAFAMVMHEIFSGGIPFPLIYHNTEVKEQVVANGMRPDRPTNAEDVGLTDRVWNLMTDCWSSEPEHRPSICFVLNELAKSFNLPVAPAALTAGPNNTSLDPAQLYKQPALALQPHPALALQPQPALVSPPPIATPAESSGTQPVRRAHTAPMRFNARAR